MKSYGGGQPYDISESEGVYVFFLLISRSSQDHPSNVDRLMA